MDTFLEVASHFALPAAATAAGALYLDVKHHIAKDINNWRAKRMFGGVVADVQRKMGDYCTLYHQMQLNDPNAEGFWFEQRSWTFGEILREADKLAQWFINQGIDAKGAGVCKMY